MSDLILSNPAILRSELDLLHNIHARLSVVIPL